MMKTPRKSRYYVIIRITAQTHREANLGEAAEITIGAAEETVFPITGVTITITMVIAGEITSAVVGITTAEDAVIITITMAIRFHVRITADGNTTAIKMYDWHSRETCRSPKH